MNYSITNDERTRRKSRIVMPGTPEYEEAMRRLMKEEKPFPPVIPSGSPEPPEPPTNQMKTSQDFWTIPNVSYRGNSVNVDILKTLLDNGNAKTQDAWASYSEQARTKGVFYTPDYPLFYSSLERAFDLKDESTYKTQIEEMRTVLKDFSRKKWLMTLTRINYSPKGKDTIVHNFRMSDKSEVLENFVGLDGELPAGSSQNVYQSLLGTNSSLDKIKNVFQWLNNTSPVYIWRVNSKPQTIDERVAGFDAYSGWAYLGCYRDPSLTVSSLGVRGCVSAEGTR